MQRPKDESDNLYLNLLIPNLVNSSELTPQNIPAEYDQTLNVALLQNPSEYYMSVVRFTLPLDLIPIFSFPVDVSQNNPNISALEIGIQTSGGTQYPQRIVYVSANNIAVPAASGSAPYFDYYQVTSPYYFIYNIQPFINMVNTALSAAYVASGGLVADAPYYIFNPQTELISLVVDATFLASGKSIFLNAALKTYFSSFNFTTLNNFVTGPYFFYHNLSTIPYGSPSGGPYIFQEEWNSLALWFDIRKVVVQSESFPVVQESSPVFSSYKIFGSAQQQNGNANYISILTDFAVTYDQVADVSSQLTYIPNPQYRLIDLRSNTPLYRIQLQFFWLSKNSYLYPVLLSPNQGVEIKLGFFKKELYKHMDISEQ